MPFTGYRITSNYGWRLHPIHRNRHFHAGIDLVKEHKAPIGAFVGGQILYAGEGKSGTGVGGYGNVVVIRDLNGCAHVYAHLDSVAVKVGQTVNKGDIIGRQGATGQVTGSHLHYEVRKTSSPSLGWTSNQEKSTHDPTQYLKNFQVLRRGDKGNDVAVFQRKLLAVGEKLPSYRDDGSFGSETEKAVQAFQSRYKLKVDGIAGPVTQNKLNELLPKFSRALIYRQGSTVMRGKDVIAVQRVVGVNDDSLYGPATANAVKDYQRKHRLTVDGYCGPQTWNHMFVG